MNGNLEEYSSLTELQYGSTYRKTNERTNKMKQTESKPDDDIIFEQNFNSLGRGEQYSYTAVETSMTHYHDRDRDWY